MPERLSLGDPRQSRTENKIIQGPINRIRALRDNEPMPELPTTNEEGEKRDQQNIIILIGILTKYKIQQGAESWLGLKHYHGDRTDREKEEFKKVSNNKLRRAWFNSGGGFTQLLIDSIQEGDRDEEEQTQLPQWKKTIRHLEQRSHAAERKAIFTRDVHGLEAVAYGVLHFLDRKGRVEKNTKQLREWFDHVPDYEAKAAEKARIAAKPNVLATEARAAEAGRFGARLHELHELAERMHASFAQEISDPFVFLKRVKEVEAADGAERIAERFLWEQEEGKRVGTRGEQLLEELRAEKNPKIRARKEEDLGDETARLEAATFVEPFKPGELFRIVADFHLATDTFLKTFKVVTEKSKNASLRKELAQGDSLPKDKAQALHEEAERAFEEANQVFQAEKANIQTVAKQICETAERLAASHELERERGRIEFATRLADAEYDAAWNVGAAEELEKDAIGAAERARLERRAIQRTIEYKGDAERLLQEAEDCKKNALAEQDDPPIREAWLAQARILETAARFAEEFRDEKALTKEAGRLDRALSIEERRETDATKARLALARVAARTSLQREDFIRHEVGAPRQRHSYSPEERTEILADMKELERQMGSSFKILPGDWAFPQDYKEYHVSVRAKEDYEQGRKNKLTKGWITVVLGTIESFDQGHCKDKERVLRWTEKRRHFIKKITDQDKNTIEDIHEIEAFAIEIIEYFKNEFQTKTAAIFAEAA